LATGVSIFEWSVLRVYVVISGTIGGLILISTLIDLNLAAQIVLAGAASLVVLLLNRDVLRVGDTFPALLRFRFGRQIFGSVR
jgi:hypothetical protein